jgi:hypothetical protein
MPSSNRLLMPKINRFAGSTDVQSVGRNIAKSETSMAMASCPLHRRPVSLLASLVPLATRSLKACVHVGESDG